MEISSYLNRISSFYSSLKFNDLPYEVIHKTKLTLFDFLVVITAGKAYGSIYNQLETYLGTCGETPKATVLPMNTKCSSQTAALVMGMMSSCLELDDGHRYGTAHPATAVISAALSVCDVNSTEYAKLLLSIAVGYDAMLRLATAINPSHLKRGFHTTGTCGTIGASVAVSSIKEFNAEKTSHTVSIVALQSSGIQEMLHSNPEIKTINSGRAAHAAVLASEFVDLGFKGPVSVFEGSHGWIKAMTDEFDESALLSSLGKRFEIMYTYTKLYPSCRHCHAAIDLGIKLFNSGVSIEKIESLKLRTYGVAISEVGYIKRPRNLDEAMFSVAYALATVLKYGKARLQEISSSLNNDSILKFAQSIEIIEDEDMNSKYPHERGAVLHVTLKNNESLVLTTHLPKGEFDTPLTDDEYFQKALDLLENVKPISWIQGLWNAVVEKRDSTCDVSEIFNFFTHEVSDEII